MFGRRRRAQKEHRAAGADDWQHRPLDLLPLLGDPQIVQIHPPLGGHGDKGLNLLGRRPAFDAGEEDADRRFDFRTLGRSGFLLAEFFALPRRVAPTRGENHQ